MLNKGVSHFGHFTTPFSGHDTDRTFRDEFDQLPGVPSHFELEYKGLDHSNIHPGKFGWWVSENTHQELHNLRNSAQEMGDRLDGLTNGTGPTGGVIKPYNLKDVDHTLGNVVNHGGLQGLDPNDSSYLNSPVNKFAHLQGGNDDFDQAGEYAKLAQPYTDYMYNSIEQYSDSQVEQGNSDPRDSLRHWDSFKNLHDTMHKNYPVPCFTRGTLISTPNGEVPIESLSEGDLVNTEAGAQPIKWIGHRTIKHLHTFSRKAKLSAVPVMIQQHAIADNVPSRDMVVSPWHHLYVNNVLVRAMDLLNGSTIFYLESAKEAQYMHIELDTFNVIEANNLLSESFSDSGRNRATFSNAKLTDLQPNWHEKRGMAPRPGFTVVRPNKNGEVLNAIHQQLSNRAALLSESAEYALA
ncbi:hypothetical protein R84981_002067 [Carnimonas sp. R-84981]|uniref:Hint domain-containing protein n=1 Tax=Carnimonas bestiolae TaxID=3402172 RepID=UPI003EDCB0CC